MLASPLFSAPAALPSHGLRAGSPTFLLSHFPALCLLFTPPHSLCSVCLQELSGGTAALPERRSHGMLKGIRDQEAMAEPEVQATQGAAPPSFPRRPNSQGAGLCPHSARHSGDPEPFVSQRPKPTHCLPKAEGRAVMPRIRGRGGIFPRPSPISSRAKILKPWVSGPLDIRK